MNQAKRVTALERATRRMPPELPRPDDVSPRRWKQILRMLAEGKIDPEPWPTIAAALEDYALRPPRSILDAPDPFLIAAIELGRPKTGHAGSRAADRAPIRYSDEELELIIVAALEKVELSAAETADRAPIHCSDEQLALILATWREKGELPAAETVAEQSEFGG